MFHTKSVYTSTVPATITLNIVKHTKDKPIVITIMYLFRYKHVLLDVKKCLIHLSCTFGR